MLFNILTVFAALSAVSCAPTKKIAPVAVDFVVVRETAFRKKTGSYKLPRSIGHKMISEKNKEHSITVPNEGSYFLSALEIGSDGQEVGVILDTGSSDLWFPSKTSCTGNVTPNATTTNDELSGLPAASSACPLGAFDESSSSSYKSMNKSFALYYGVEGYYTYAKGNWAKETVKWGDMTVKDMQFGLATDQDIGQGIIGISYKGTEGVRYSEEYDNFPVQLKKQGLVAKNAYSLYLNTMEASSGTVLFGGIDKAKFEGDLTFFDTVDVNDGGVKTNETVAFFVNLDGASQGGKTLFSSSHPGLLDSGSTLLYAPEEIYKSVAPQYGEYNSTAGGYITPCATKGDDFQFHFSNFTLNVPYSQLMYNISDSDSLFVNGEGEEMCLFSMLSSSESVWILGDVLLRSAYIHYDLEDNKIGLAQAVYTNDTDIVMVY